MESTGFGQVHDDDLQLYPGNHLVLLTILFREYASDRVFGFDLLLIAFSTLLISLYSCYLIYIYNKVRKFPDFTSGGALTTVYLLTFIVNILMLLSLFHAIQPDIWLYYLSIHFYQAWSLYGFVRLMIYR